jgi:hypothetical protein
LNCLLQGSGTIYFDNGGKLFSEHFISGYVSARYEARYTPPDSKLVLLGRMDGSGCLDGRVRGVDPATGRSVYHAVYRNGKTIGPRVWRCAHSILHF